MSAAVRVAALLALACALIAAVVASAASPDHEPRVFRAIDDLDGQFIGQPLPPLTLPILDTPRARALEAAQALTTLDGRPALSLDRLRGHVVFLNLWASWCPPCVEEVPSMIKLASALADRGDDFIMVAVSWDEDPQALAAFLDRIGDDLMREHMVLLHDPGGRLTRALGTRQLPETYLIDQQGELIARFQDKRDWSGTEALRAMQALLYRR